MSIARFAVLGLMALAACTTVPNDVAEGVGFGDYDEYRTARQAQLRGDPPPQTVRPPEQVAQPQASSTVISTPIVTASPAQPTTTVTARAAAAIAEAETGSAPVQTATTTAPVRSSNPAISDEQDFGAVSARESIESDAERRVAMQAQRVEVQPTAIPDRPGATGPNIVEYALSTTHPVGQQIYRRSPFGQGRHDRNCLAYRSDDLAQEAFLANGGPQRDRQALDPDGDGYACGWNPEVFRNAAQSARGG